MASKLSLYVSLYLMVGCIKYQFNKSILGYDIDIYTTSTTSYN